MVFSHFNGLDFPIFKFDLFSSPRGESFGILSFLQQRKSGRSSPSMSPKIQSKQRLLEYLRGKQRKLFLGTASWKKPWLVQRGTWELTQGVKRSSRFFLRAITRPSLGPQLRQARTQTTVRNKMPAKLLERILVPFGPRAGEGKRTSAWSVGNTSFLAPSSSFIKGHTLGRSHMSAQTVGKPSGPALCFTVTSGSTLGRSRINALSVGGDLAAIQI